MAEVIQFPRKIGSKSQLDVIKAFIESDNIAVQIEGACRAMLSMLRQNKFKPDKFFILYQEGNTVSQMGFNVTTDELANIIDVILQYKAEHGSKRFDGWS